MSGPPVSLHVALLLRIAVATALGAVIGLERQIHRRPAGLRTHMLIARDVVHVRVSGPS